MNEHLLMLIAVILAIGFGYLILRLLPCRCWQCGELTKCKSPGGLYMCEDCGGRQPCEGCGAASVQTDVEGVHLCRDCWDACPHANGCKCRACTTKHTDQQLAKLLDEEMKRIEEGRQP